MASLLAHQLGGCIGHEQCQRLLGNAFAAAAAVAAPRGGKRCAWLRARQLLLRIWDQQGGVRRLFSTSASPWSTSPGWLRHHDLNLRGARLVMVVQEDVDIACSQGGHSLSVNPAACNAWGGWSAGGWGQAAGVTCHAAAMCASALAVWQVAVQQDEGALCQAREMDVGP